LNEGRQQLHITLGKLFIKFFNASKVNDAQPSVLFKEKVSRMCIRVDKATLLYLIMKEVPEQLTEMVALLLRGIGFQKFFQMLSFNKGHRKHFIRRKFFNPPGSNNITAGETVVKVFNIFSFLLIVGFFDQRCFNLLKVVIEVSSAFGQPFYQ